MNVKDDFYRKYNSVSFTKAYNENKIPKETVISRVYHRKVLSRYVINLDSLQVKDIALEIFGQHKLYLKGFLAELDKSQSNAPLEFLVLTYILIRDVTELKEEFLLLRNMIQGRILSSETRKETQLWSYLLWDGRNQNAENPKRIFSVFIQKLKYFLNIKTDLQTLYFNWLRSDNEKNRKSVASNIIQYWKNHLDTNGLKSDVVLYYFLFSSCTKYGIYDFKFFASDFIQYVSENLEALNVIQLNIAFQIINYLNVEKDLLQKIKDKIIGSWLLNIYAQPIPYNADFMENECLGKTLVSAFVLKNINELGIQSE